MRADHPKSVGLGGDGDEITAIEDVERAFGVKLDDTDAPSWHTAGDVFASLRNVLPNDLPDDAALWRRFAEALSTQSGVDPASIEKDSPLLSESRLLARIADTSAILGTVIVLGFFAVVAATALFGR